MNTQPKSPIVILNVTYTVFSIARHYGSCKAYGTVYFYDRGHDALVRQDYLKKMKGKTWDEFIEFVKSA